MSPTAPRQPRPITPPRLVMLRDKCLARLTHRVDGPEPFTLLGQTIAAQGRPPEPLLWRADGHHGEWGSEPHYLDIVAIDTGEIDAGGRTFFAPFTGLPGAKKGTP